MKEKKFRLRNCTKPSIYITRLQERHLGSQYSESQNVIKRFLLEYDQCSFSSPNKSTEHLKLTLLPELRTNALCAYVPPDSPAHLSQLLPQHPLPSLHPPQKPKWEILVPSGTGSHLVPPHMSALCWSPSLISYALCEGRWVQSTARSSM